VRTTPWLALLLATGAGALTGCDSHSASSDSPNADDVTADATSTNGRLIYETQCATCHGPEGQGVAGLHPPLTASEWVQAPPARLAALTLDGLQGPLVVNGVTYRGVMPAWRLALTDGQIAAVLTYIRAAWGNNAPPVTSVVVGEIRNRDLDRNAFWSPQELLQTK
jgi:mono/diheme cytochrome c family protein